MVPDQLCRENLMKIRLTLAATAIALTTFGLGAANAANLVTNGSFSTNTGNGELGFNTSATGWSVPNGSYNFLYTSAAAAETGANGQDGLVPLWGPANGSNNGLGNSPDGGAFVALDTDFGQGALSQTIGGLTIGQKYTVSFDWGAAQQYNFFGSTTESLAVSLGSQTIDTSTVINPSKGFSGWYATSMTFTANATSESLAFLAQGPGAPPFALLDGVSMTAAVPEPATWAMFLVGFGGIGFMLRNRRKGAVTTA
jgi:PEP-CTERM motif